MSVVLLSRSVGYRDRRINWHKQGLCNLYVPVLIYTVRATYNNSPYFSTRTGLCCFCGRRRNRQHGRV